MTYFRVDDGFYDHPKVDACSDAAIALWTKAGSWCGRYLTDGKVPADRVRKLGYSEDVAQELVHRGLWVGLPDGFLFHQWETHQEKKADVEAERARWKETKRAQRAAKRQAKSEMSTLDSIRESRESPASSPLLSSPSQKREERREEKRGEQSAAARPGAGAPPPALELVPTVSAKRPPTARSQAGAALRKALADLGPAYGHEVTPTASATAVASGAAKVAGIAAKGVPLADAASRVARGAYELLAAGRKTSLGYALQDLLIGPAANAVPSLTRGGRLERAPAASAADFANAPPISEQLASANWE